ncbi:acyl-CoA dehydrogenase [Comamonas piscis]|uniref:Acyl-CoA dehydrogenase n=1 Tax=Comamonas piscis TaxID=1562974 RepID=A0A7G5EH82_9BURK|nr:acyl-CoA dehydrogenase [Comamonas piscis]QMV73357.1 acyl-CoA dehydrogenase [Comamonas piscis]WSO36160.1 acyl-CoA dehydrogenase [Comamonas piscis]
MTDASRPLEDFLTFSETQEPGEILRALVAQGLDQLPLPGQGHTLARWRALAAVAAHNLSLVKLFEGHTDALAILAELGAQAPAAARTWAVWGAEPPANRVQATLARLNEGLASGSEVLLSGTKAWCSGARSVDQALVTAWLSDTERCLVAVNLHQPEVQVCKSGWEAVGMAASASVDVRFENASATLVGTPGAYLSRPGFQHGGAGIAACWYGASARMAGHLRQACRSKAEPHALAHLGAVDIALSTTAALLRVTAAQIDAQPALPWTMDVNRCRLAAEAAAQQVLQHVPRALGPGPFCKDRSLALLLADLPIFIRQCHAERDLAALGQAIAEQENNAPWKL